VNKLGSKPAVLDTVRALLDHCCPLLVDSRCVSMMVEKVVRWMCMTVLPENVQCFGLKVV